MASDRFRSAVQVGLAMTLAYGIGMAMGWDKPYWAGIAIAVTSLATTGESLLKGLRRLAGTAVAMVVATALLATVAQERWAFGALTSLWLAFCTWQVGASPRPYFWFCAGFSVPLFSVMSDLEGLTAFEVMVLRAQQTFLGIACFTVVASAVFPRNARNALTRRVEEEVTHLARKTGDLRGRITGADGVFPAAVLPGARGSNTGALADLVAAARVESFEVSDHAQAWGEVVATLDTASDALDRLELALADAPSAWSTERLGEALGAIRSRLDGVAALFSSGKRLAISDPFQDPPLPDTQPGTGAFELAERLQRADLLHEFDEATRRLADAAARTAGPARPAGPTGTAREVTLSPATARALPISERVAIVMRQTAVFWLAFLAYTYLPAIPNGPVVVILSASLGISLMLLPTFRPISLLLPALIAFAGGGAAHVLVMPHLVGFAQLGLVLFFGSFLIVWVCDSPKMAIGRSVGLVLFTVVTNISNEQTYSVTNIFNTVVVFGLILLIIAVTQHLPISWRPEYVIRTLLRRYSDAIVAVLNDLPRELSGSDGGRARRAALCELHALPGRIGVWTRALPKGVPSEAERDALLNLADRLQVLSLRLTMLARLRGEDTDPIWLRVLGDEVRAWRLGLRDVAESLGRPPMAFVPSDLEERLGRKLRTLEARIADATESGATETADTHGTAHMLRGISSFRGVSQAVISVIEAADGVDWRRLAAPRF